MFIAQVEQDSLQSFEHFDVTSMVYKSIENGKLFFVHFLQPCQLNVLKRPLTPFLAKGVQKMACCRKGKTVRDFHGLEKYCTKTSNSSFL